LSSSESADTGAGFGHLVVPAHAGAPALVREPAIVADHVADLARPRGDRVGQRGEAILGTIGRGRQAGIAVSMRHVAARFSATAAPPCASGASMPGSGAGRDRGEQLVLDAGMKRASGLIATIAPSAVVTSRPKRVPAGAVARTCST
jgi:hypothetical protein